MSAKPEWSEIERALGLALQMNESERSGFLAGLPEAVRTEVKSLLEADGRAGNFLASGTRRGIVAGAMLGAYRIEKQIGEGGMGVVYLGTDTKLNRPVAVKFLPADVADAATRKRFQREALMASSLNHPHILTVHDAGEYEGWPYLVTEFVDGGTLKDWARAQKRDWREIVGLMAGVADGLAAAHAANILHRDIKPGNILVARNGYAKLADFGLAKIEEKGSQDEATRTLASEISKPGMIVGTIPYMSPEQASGLHTDGRSDIFSFGVVLYELLMGKRPFQGATDVATLQAIRTGTMPPLSEEVPLPLRMIVEKALEHDPANRYQSARDLVVDLRRVGRQSGEISAPAPNQATDGAVAAGAGTVTRRKVWMAIAGCAAALLAGGAVWRMERPAAQTPGRVFQFDIQAPAGTIFAPSITRLPFGISPDGKRLALTATGMNGTNVWLRELSSLDIRPLTGTEGAWSVFWAPDSKTVYFSVKETLKQANVETGSWRAVKELPDLMESGTWLANGNLLAYLSGVDLLEFHPKDGSTSQVANSKGHRWPQAIPGKNRILYVDYDPKAGVSHGFVADYPGDAATKPVMLMETDTRVEYAPPGRKGDPGHLVFIRGGSLLAQPFDVERMQLAGEPFSIAQNVPYYGPSLSANFSVSPNGVLVYQSGFPNAELKWYDRGGKELSATGKGMAHWGQVRLSRDGKRVAATIWTPENGGTEIWIVGADGRESSRLTFPPEVARRPAWSPDGTRIAVGRSPRVGGPKLAIVDLGTGKAEYFLGGESNRHTGFATDWSKDGRFIALDDGVGQEVHDVQLADLQAQRYVPLLKSPFPQWGVAFSPDGRQIAFLSLESGRPEVYLQGFEAAPEPHVTGPKRQVSTGGAWLVRWRGDGREMYFVGLDNVLHAAPVTGVAAVGEAKALFQIPGVAQYGTTRDFQFDVSADGQRFLMPNTGSVAPLPLTVIENWQEKFRR